jgi:hypothetical protein
VAPTLLKKEAATRLGITPTRVSQLIKEGHLFPDENGRISEDELARCRRQAPVAWQTGGAKSGRRSAAQIEAERRRQGWVRIAAKCHSKARWDLSGPEVEAAWLLLRELVAEHLPEAL